MKITKDNKGKKEESIKESTMIDYLDISVEDLSLLLFEVGNQEMSVRQLRQYLFNQRNQEQVAIKILPKAK